METAPTVLRTCGLLLYFIFQVISSATEAASPTIQSLKVDSITCDKNTCKYLLSVSGGDFLGHKPWRLTSEEGVRGSSCEIIYPNYELKEIDTAQWVSKIEVTVPNISGKIYFCLRDTVTETPFSGSWVHQGVEYHLEPEKDVIISQENESNTAEPKTNDIEEQKYDVQETQNLEDVSNKNETQEANSKWSDLTHDIDVNYLTNVPRPTREERNDIEVLINQKFIPLNELIEHIKIDSKNSIQILDQNNDIVKDNNQKLIALPGKVDKEELDNMKSNILLDYTKEIINKIDLAITKLQCGKNKREVIDTDLSNEIINIKSDTSIQDTDNIAPINIYKTAMPHQEIGKEVNVNTVKDTEEIIEKLDKLLDKIQSVKCIQEEYSFGIYSKHMPSPSAYDLNINSEKTLLHDMDSDMPLFDIHMKSQNILLPNMDSKELQPNARVRRQIPLEDDFTRVRAATTSIMIEGIRVEDSDKEPKIIEGGIPSVLAESSVTLRIYGTGLTNRTVIAFTHDPQPYGQPCKFLLKGEYMVKEGSLDFKTALVEIRAPSPLTGSKLYICAKNLHPNRDPASDEEKYLHQGVEGWKMFAVHNKLLPLWVSIVLILFCLMFSALFSGLNLGLMSLDRTELKIIANTGTEQERKYARAIMPVRDHGNYLLCSILLGNVAVNSTFTILLDELTSGLFAVIFSTLAIVLLGEITPQAICSRHGLMVGAKSIMVTKGVMAVTAPLSFPVSKLLDYFLGEEIGNVYNRERLKELVKVTTDMNDLDKDEVNIISGALEMRKKTVKDVMTKLEDVFMLPITSVLDFETMSEIVKSGYSRIPVYEGSRGNIVTVLYIKDLAFVDPDDNTPLQTLCQYYQNAAHFVFEDVTLDVMFKQFKDGHKGHMAFVHRINNEGEGDPFYETIGLVTLEDVIEEMIQSEIVDETDVFFDNKSKRRRRPENKLQDFAAFAERHENQRIHISPQLTLATFQFLSTSVDAFRPDTVSETVLRRLLRQDVIQHIKVKDKSKRDPNTYVFQQGKPVDYFVLILEGRVEVTVGRENLVFEAGPFTYFGVQALSQNVGVAESPTPSAMGSLQNINMDAMLRYTFVPDYSVRAITSLCYLTVKRSLYLAAKRASLMEKGNISKGGTTQEFDTEVDKNLCNTSSANIPISMISKKLLGKSTSTLSTRDDALSSTSGIKPAPRLNLIELMQATLHNYPSSEKVDITEKYLKGVNNTASITEPDKLLQSVDEDLSITGEHKTPSRQVSPHPVPASPAPRSIVDRNGHAYAPTHRNSQSEEQERLLK